MEPATELDFGEIYNNMFGNEHKIVMKFADDWRSLKNDPIYQELNDMVSRIYEDRINIDEEIKEQAHWLANNFSTRNGYTSMEENLIKMGEFVKNRMLDKYNLENQLGNNEYTGVISMEHYDSGEENGIKWFVDLNPSKGEWNVTVTNDVETKTESFHWTFEPRFGIDVLDANKIESILDKFINELKNHE